MVDGVDPDVSMDIVSEAADADDASKGTSIGDIGTRRSARSQRVTMREVARASGVSRSTVSRILGDVPTTVRITDATRRRVLEQSRELGYRPDPLARGLRGSSTSLIGLIVRDLAYPLHGPLIEHVIEAVRAHEHHVVIGSSGGLASETLQLEHIIQTRMCDGIAIIGGLDDSAAVVDELHDANLPNVGIGIATTDGRIPVVRSDNQQGARLAFEHLAELGHRRVGLLVTGDHPEFVDRADTFIAAARARTWPPDAITSVRIDNLPAAAAAAFSAMMDQPVPPTAIFVTSDHAAYGVLGEAVHLGLDVPGQLSVVGFDDLGMSASVTPPLTTVHQDLRRLAEQAVSIVFEMIRTGRQADDAPSKVPVSLSVRSSTGPAPA